MSTIPAGDYLFVHYGFGGDDFAPQLSLLPENGSEFVALKPRGDTITLAFDKTQRFCGGWHDLATTQSFPCPDNTKLPEAYNQCRHCQTKTGFNPAFYNAVSVSEQQTARNQQPHTLYLAHFGPGMVKVGISWAERGLRRLLDQGARSCLILKTYPNADLARQYEAKIAKLPGIAETLQVRAKQQLLGREYDAASGHKELINTRDRLIQDVGFTPEDNQPIHLDKHYIDTHQLQPHTFVDLSGETNISGKCIGMIGSTLLVQQDDSQFGLPLSKLTGYRMTLGYDEVPNQHQPQQASLF